MSKLAAILAIGAVFLPYKAIAVEITPLEVHFATVPANLDILGVKTGMSVLDAENALRDRGYFKEGRFNDKPFPCRDHVCITYKGAKGYEAAVRYTKGNDEVYLRYSPPYAGWAVMEITRKISYDNAPRPTFENLFKEARPKYGRAVVWDKLGKACWDFENGALLLKPELDAGRACSTIKRNSDGFLAMVRSPRDLEVNFVMVDKLIEREIEKLAAGVLDAEAALRRSQRQQQMEKAATPEL